VLPNGVDAARLTRLTGEARRGDRLLFVGRNEPRKGLAILLRAFAGLPGTPSLELVGVAPSELATEAKGLPRSVLARIDAHGRTSDAERDRILGRVDILCAPSLHGESFGVVVLEGMAAGLPVVASSLLPYRRLVARGCGLLIPPGDVGAVRSALRELLEDRRLRARMGAAGRRRAQRFDWSRVGSRVIAVYEEALRARGLRAGRAAGRRTGWSPLVPARPEAADPTGA
jgi:phosphatidyl-myo-inositol alpha-mannosyltransferase